MPRSRATKSLRALPAAFCAMFLAASVPLTAFPGMNPSSKGLPQVDTYVTGMQFNGNSMSAVCVACHTRAPNVLDNASRGSHFVFKDFDNRTQHTATWEKTTPWDNTTYSKYGNSQTSNQPSGTAGEMICESCHNMLKNTGRYKLLASDSDTADPNPLCMGCHPAGSLPGHHPLTGETVASRGAPLSTTAGGALSTPLDNATYPGTNKMNCRSCHRVHGAQTATGARILKKGIGAGVTGAGTSGAERQVDIDPSGAQRLVTDYTPLCASCHAQ